MKSRLFILGLLTIALLATAALTAQPKEEACTLTLDPATVEAGGSASLQVEVSRWIGTVSRVEIDAESGATVLENALDETSGYTVEVNLEDAKPGEWKLALHGEHGLCSGMLNIR